MGSSSSRRRQSEDYEAQLTQAEARLEAGPSSSEYDPGSASEFYTPTEIATPVTPFGEVADTFSLEVLIDNADKR